MPAGSKSSLIMLAGTFHGATCMTLFSRTEDMPLTLAAGA